MNIHEALIALEEIYGPFGPQDAVSQQELDFAAREGGIGFPPALQVLYLRTGRSEALHKKHNVLLAPKEATVTDGHLIFYRENQGVCDWGIPIGRVAVDDPPVHTSYRAASGELEWLDEFRSVSEFLCVQGAWQAIQGGLPFVGVVSDTELAGAPSKSHLGVRARKAASCVGREYVAAKGTTAWIVQGSVFAMGSDAYFGMGARKKEQFLQASELLGIPIDDWDYATLRDEL